jgi:zinc and cadmium transporter
MVSLAVGALLGDAFIHLIPEAFESARDPLMVSLAIVAGVLVFFVIEKFLHWHHHAAGEHDHETIHPTGKLILISDAAHNFIDGLIIGASFLVSTEVGIATTLAVILHEIPQEIGDFGVLLHSGYSKTKALWFNFLSALTAIVGVLVALFLGGAGEFVSTWLVPVAAGGFIYIALSDLIPELHKSKTARTSAAQFIAILIGVLAMVVLLAFE